MSKMYKNKIQENSKHKNCEISLIDNFRNFQTDIQKCSKIENFKKLRKRKNFQNWKFRIFSKMKNFKKIRNVFENKPQK